jgi:hypothetical protein
MKKQTCLFLKCFLYRTFSDNHKDFLPIHTNKIVETQLISYCFHKKCVNEFLKIGHIISDKVKIIVCLRCFK